MKKIYEYDDNPTIGIDDNIPVKITRGPYKGTIFTYGSVSFKDENESVKCHFEYNILEKSEDLVEDGIFINQLGEILVDILTEEIEEVEEDFLRSGITPKYEDS